MNDVKVPFNVVVVTPNVDLRSVVTSDDDGALVYGDLFDVEVYLGVEVCVLKLTK